ncbi:MAG: aldo/keto reductase [Eubacteriales bacterium]
MYYKQYGNTDMKVSAIGMGCMRYDDELINAGNLDACSEVALYAHEKGINYFDTAPFYCQDKSEIITGMALSQLKRDSFYVSSKMNLGTVDGVATKDAFYKRLHTTLDRLKVDYLDVYHLWCLLSPESYEKQSELLYGYFEDAKREGLVKNIAFSSHMEGGDLSPIINSDKFKAMLIGYNAINYRFRQAGILDAHNKGMGVVVMNPLGGGAIPQNPSMFEYLAEGTDLTVPQAALRFVASHKEITITLAGMTKKEHVDDAVKAVEGLEEFSANDIYKKYENSHLSLNNLCTGCGYCKKCPMGIDIPKFMDTYNQKLFGDNMDDRMQNHWHITKEEAAKCIACGKCESLCTQHLPIIDRLAEIANM